MLIPRYIYLILTLCACASLALHVLTPVEIAFDRLTNTTTFGIQMAVLLLMLHIIYRRGAMPEWIYLRLATLVELLFLLPVFILSLRILDLAKLGLNFPLADPWLAAADALIGLDWIAYFTWVHDRPELHRIMERYYAYLEYALACTALSLLLFGRLKRLRLLVEAFVICAVISIVFGAIFPARAAVDYLAGSPENWPNFGMRLPGTYHIQTLDALRSAALGYRIAEYGMPGMVTFPSLHTAAALLIICATWRTILVVPACAFSLPMIATTPIWGGHYFIDLVAGAVLAFSVYFILSRRGEEQRGHSPSPPLPVRR